MLLDKGYYDYDYEAVMDSGKSRRRVETDAERNERIQSMIKRFGFGKVKKEKKKPLTPEQLQAEIMTEGAKDKE